MREVIELNYKQLTEEFLEHEECEEIGSNAFKHDITSYTVVSRVGEGYYMLTYNASYNHGIEGWDAPWEAHPCHKVTKTIEVWETL